MKLKNLVVMLAVAMCVTACSNDEDEAPFSEKVAGTYTGYTQIAGTIPGSGASMDFGIEKEQTFTVTANTNATTVSVSYTSATYGKTVLSDATVTVHSNGSYTISGKGTTEMSGMSGSVSSYPCNFEATISMDKSEVAFTLSIVNAMNFVITFHSGEAPIALSVAGTYKGYTKVTGTIPGSGAPMDFGTEIDQTLTIAANADGTLDISYTSTTYGASVISGATITTNADGSYTISGTGTTEMSGMSGSASSYPCNLEATVNADKSEATFALSIVNAMNFVITFHNGDAPSTGE